MESTPSKIEKVPKSNSEREKIRFKVKTCKIGGENVYVAKGHTSTLTAGYEYVNPYNKCIKKSKGVRV